uniref:Uncharacterized protein n=1 Tax=Arundo donax TaxID=35708 RepID=A0A0A9AFL3_ARUDO
MRLLPGRSGEPPAARAGSGEEAMSPANRGSRSEWISLDSQLSRPRGADGAAASAPA